MRLLPAILLVLAMRIPVMAQMADSDAMIAAHAALGPQANIAQVRNWIDTYWTRQVGVKSVGCTLAFTPLATGLNTWDAAFLAMTATPPVVAGPFAGAGAIHLHAWDNVAVVGFTLVVDGANYPEIVMPAAPVWAVNFTIDTALLADGVHVLCAHARDAAGNVGASARAWLFSTNQASGMAAWNWTPPQQASPVITP